MILKKLIFNNYKTFYGQQEIDLYIPKDVREEKKQNIILLGGLNGAGKTTILKAIIYVLFGKRGMNDTEYKKLSANVINNTFFDEGGRESLLTLILETDSGEEWKLNVKWFFDRLKRVTHEERELYVKKPGSNQAQHARIENIEVYNKFIDRIIPYYAAPFFIFDGEEIKDIILRQNSQEMKDAIHKITGMDAYKQLLTDLDTLRISIVNKMAKSTSQKELSTITTALVELEQDIEKREIKKEKYQNEIRKYETMIQDAKEQRNDKLTLNSKSREAIVKQQSRAATELQLKNDELQEYLQEHTVNIILRDKIAALKKNLQHENDSKHKKIIQNASLSPYRNFMSQLLKKNISPALTKPQLEQIHTLGEEIWITENSIKETVPSDFKETHDISSSEYTYLMNLSIKDKGYISHQINEIEKMKQSLEAYELKLRNAPKAVNIEDENNKIDILTKKTGEIYLRFKTVKAKLDLAYETRTNLKNKLSRIVDQDGSLEELKERLNHIDRTITAMKKYVTEVTLMKASIIKEEFSYMLEKLFRKQDEFGKIEFDINTYSIRLYNDRMQESSIEDRSAGEMQMISSALIWALTKASDLALPMVIDTPLGRLDSYHRNHLINHYYKNLSEQVIILSTDTEITQDYIKLMENHSYKQYMLDYNETKKYTIIRDGYFNFIKG